jgi:hypothetical protein
MTICSMMLKIVHPFWPRPTFIEVAQDFEDAQQEPPVP